MILVKHLIFGKQDNSNETGQEENAMKKKRYLFICFLIAMIFGVGAFAANSGSENSGLLAGILRTENKLRAGAVNNADILVEYAKAYDRQGGQIEYDQAGATDRRFMTVSPEDATSQKKIYLDCSSYVNACYWEAFGMNVLPYSFSEKSGTTSNYNIYARDNTDNDDVIGYWENAKITTDAQKKEIVNFIKSNIQVGDVLNYRHKKSSGTAGHVYIYIGNNTFMHCYGAGSYKVGDPDPAKSHDNSASEAVSGQITTISIDSILTDTSHTRYIFKATEADTVTSFCLLRPMARGTVTPTEEALARMSIAGLDFERTTSTYVNSALNKGDILTYTVELDNTNATELKDVVFEDCVPAGTEVESVSDGMTINGNNISWKGDIKSKTVVTLEYSVKITANPGQTIISDSAYVGGVKLDVLRHTVSGIEDTHELMIQEIASKFVSEGKAFQNSLELVTELYKSALGVKLKGYTTVDSVLSNIIDKDNLTCFTSTDFAKVTVPTLFGGTSISDGCFKIPDSDRTRIIDKEELAVGDIILADWDNGEVVYVYVGNSTLLTTKNGVCTTLTIGDNIYGVNADNILISLIGYKRFAVLRPSLAGIEPALSIKSLTATTPKKVDYYNGEKFNPEGMTVTAKLSNGEEWVLPNYEITPEILTYPMDNVTISFGNVSTTVAVNVSKDVRKVSIEEASVLDKGLYAQVEGIYVGVANRGRQTDSEIILKDESSDTLISVVGVPYGAYPNFGYTYGDKVCLTVTVEESTVANIEGKKYLQFSESNGDIESTILSKGNAVNYKFDNVITVENWEDMQKLYALDKIEPYSYIKFTGSSYFNYYSHLNTYRLHKNASSVEMNDVEPDGKRSVSFGKDYMDANLGEGWLNRLFGISDNATFPGAKADKTFYAVYMGADSYGYQMVILNDNWVE